MEQPRPDPRSRAGARPRHEAEPASPGSGLPAALRLAWWGTAWLQGRVSLDETIDAVIGDQATHTLVDADGTHPLALGLGRLRSAGAMALGVAFPVEGDPVGLGGPAAFTAAALEAGEAVVAWEAGLGLVPETVGAATAWVRFEARRRQLPDVGEADRALRRVLPETADRLAALDVARWRPEVADVLLDLRHRAPIAAPDGVPARCVDLAARALVAEAIVDLALEDDGGAVSASEIALRRDALRPLASAARHALVAAGSPEVWPPA
ncbi:hypothetical protein K8Z61_05415 [Nocardioides sp. TRM66260-LWL]|uniref:hypothetical protein n=1 Tax=Nocardioides sp. TRM66260-LWL TaxID=2874478 RepID=UPI001CC4F889|nr:hypothetical protein [Nocardioides sp. TRM66260-LWL]MBZ5733928.1 hypothetical protein [Nocardioides sp. TRM66260-LWL]